MNIVFDLDDTLADTGHRQHFVEGAERDFESFHRAAEHDKVIVPMQKTFIALKHFYLPPGTGSRKSGSFNHIEIWTGRNQLYRPMTVHWLQRNRIMPHRLRMRADGDFRPDREVKGEWLADFRSNGTDVDIIFDDRARSIAFWREQGILALDVKGNPW